MSVNDRVIVILGPTASGKTNLSIELAQKYNAYIISADSRQVYTGMDIATGKITGSWKQINSQNIFVAHDIPHFLIDCIDPNKEFSLSDWQKLTLQIINNKSHITDGKVPIIVGGTGLYISSIVDNYQLPKSKTDKELRAQLEALSLKDLLHDLEQLDPKTFEVIDHANKRKVIRALEFAKQTNQSFTQSAQQSDSPYDILQIGIEIPREALYEKINNRVDHMFKNGIIEEAQQLITNYSIDLPSMSGIGYHEIKQYLDGNISLEQAKSNIKQHSRNYAKRQLTWFKRDSRIKWITNIEQAEALIDAFLA